MSTASTSADLRELNRARALALVHELAAVGLTRVELAEQLDVTRTTAAALVNDLAALKLITESVAAPTGRRGRPTTKVAPDPEGPVVLCLEVGHAKLLIAAMGIGGQLDNLQEVPLETAHPDCAMQQIDTVLHEYRKTLARRCAGIGVAMHGLVDDHSGMVVQAPYLGWENVELGEHLRRSHGLPVIVENDATLGGIVEAKLGAGRDEHTMLYLRSTIGVGGGFIFDGQPAPSRRGWHGEFGHLPFGNPTARCRCGAYGCWEIAVNHIALAEAAGLDTRTGDANVLAREVFARAATGEVISTKAVESICAVLGRGLGSLINAFDPAVIVLSGHVQSLHEANPLAVVAALKDATMTAHRESLPPVRSGLFDDASLRGAGEMILTELIASPSVLLAPPEDPNYQQT